ncbi:nicotinate-nicotinamide nucleotide adenylyltransferase, partial [Halomonas sp. BBD48]|nr:nicotinate-nicotinamide nucleotide adenylyltransferase [Halomonas sp. BBD48]
AFLKLAEWHAPERLFSFAHVVVIERPGYAAELPGALRELVAGREAEHAEALFAQPAGGVLRLALPSRMAISATDVRQRLRSGRSIRYLVPERVESFIQSRNLYR